MTNVVVIVAFATGALQSLRNIHCNEKFVFDDEDRAPSGAGCAMTDRCAASANARGRAVFLWWAAVSRAGKHDPAGGDR